MWTELTVALSQPRTAFRIIESSKHFSLCGIRFANKCSYITQKQQHSLPNLFSVKISVCLWDVVLLQYGTTDAELHIIGTLENDFKFCAWTLKHFSSN